MGFHLKNIPNSLELGGNLAPWISGFHYCTTSQLRFCAGSNPARGGSEIHDGEDLLQWSGLEIRLNAFRRSTIPQKQFIIITIIIIIIIFPNIFQGITFENQCYSPLFGVQYLFCLAYQFYISPSMDQIWKENPARRFGNYK